jgi:hypothetical protein
METKPKRLALRVLERTNEHLHYTIQLMDIIIDTQSNFSISHSTHDSTTPNFLLSNPFYLESLHWLWVVMQPWQALRNSTANNLLKFQLPSPLLTTLSSPPWAPRKSAACFLFCESSTSTYPHFTSPCLLVSFLFFLRNPAKLLHLEFLTSVYATFATLQHI